MGIYILLALLNGICIAISRILNGQLSRYSGAFRSSFINHLGGFIFLSILFLILTQSPQISSDGDISVYAGGVIGAIYVAINNAVMTRLGSTNAIILVISGQMFFGLFLNQLSGLNGSLFTHILGITLIIIGIAVKELIKHHRSTTDINSQTNQ